MRDSIVREYADALRALHARRREHRLCPIEDLQRREDLYKAVYDAMELVAYLKAHHNMTSEEQLRARQQLREDVEEKE